MDWHVEIISFERVRHFPKTLKGILSRSLFKAKSLCGFLTFLKRSNKGGGGGTKHLKPRQPPSQRKQRTEHCPYLRNALGASPLSFGKVSQGREETVGVVIILAAVAEQQLLVVLSSTAHPANKRVHLQREPITTLNMWRTTKPKGITGLRCALTIFFCQLTH